MEECMVQVQVLRVFIDEQGRYGNPLGVVLDPTGLGQDDRQAIATRLGYSETVFVEDPVTARLQIFTPASELPFAGHPLVGVSWLLARENGAPLHELRPVLLAKPVPTFAVDGTTWVRGSVSDAPPWEHVQLDGAAEVEAVDPPPAGGIWQKTQIWAWDDEAAGTVRARTFAQAFGVVEDEACGSATLMLAAMVGRNLTVRHGRGSVVLARPTGPGTVEIGGRVADGGTTSA
jgi:predicted PhzF superfamily epimerase YddE/YHI9